MGQALPISYEEMTTFAGKVLRINGSLESLFYRCIEETDNAVLQDTYEKQQAIRAAEKEKDDRAKSVPRYRRDSRPQRR